MSTTIRRTIHIVLSAAIMVSSIAASKLDEKHNTCPDGSDLPCKSSALQFTRDEAGIRNYFFQQGLVAAHLLTTSGVNPRVVWAFPAGNTGVGLWFDPTARGVELRVKGGLAPVDLPGGMRGVRATLTCDGDLLRVKRAILGNLRLVRDYFYGTPIPIEFNYTLKQGARLLFEAAAVDRHHHIRVLIEPKNDTRVVVDGETVTFHGPGHIELQTTALTDYEPLTPFAAGDLVTAAAADDPTALQALRFLAYKEKIMAGSWRFLTYFGRDTLLSLKMLMPVLKPQVVEAGLGSVIDRIGKGTSRISEVSHDLSVDGAVAHEEATGDYAWFTRSQMKQPMPSAPGDEFAPLLDYKMIDGDFLLLTLLAEYAASPAGAPRMATFLARTTPGGESYLSAVKRNVARVRRLATPFYQAPIAKNLIGDIHPTVGNWRDTSAGLGGGHYPYDVNVALVPAALQGAAALWAAGFLGRPDTSSKELDAMANHWLKKAPQFFSLTVTLDIARERVQAYARAIGLDPQPALQSLDGPITYMALSLDEQAKPVPIINSDDALVMLFTQPPSSFLRDTAGEILRPFPAGLRTDQGILVANPVFADAALQAKFTRGDYHGTVIWSWQQAALAAGIERQLRRNDLDKRTVSQLKEAQTVLWQRIEADLRLTSGELWSWKAVDGKTQFESYHDAAVAEHRFVDESNAIQLWSTVYLAVKPPVESKPPVVSASR